MRRITGRFLDWIIVASGGLILLGAVLVSRAANEGRLENDLISPWHVPLYAGVFIAAYALLASADRSRGILWRSELPDGYAIAGLGLVFFMVGVVTDIVWGAIVGPGTDVVSLFTPTHLLAIIGIALVLIGPVRAPLRHGGRHLVDRLPAVVSLGLVLGLAGWTTQYASPVTQVLARQKTASDLLADKSELWTMRPDGSRQTRLTLRSSENASGPSLARSGGLMAYVSWSYVSGEDPSQPQGVTSAVRVKDGSGTTIHTIVGDGGWLTGPVWSPDGSRLALTVNHRAPTGAKPATGIPTPPGRGPQANEPPAPADAGSTSSGWQWDLALVASDGSAPPDVIETTAATDVVTDWSPDGSALLGHSDRSGNWEVYRIGSASRQFRNLTNSPAADTWAAWSADGQRIAFSSDREGGRSHIWVMNADGGELRQLTHGDGEDWAPAWSPDGARIAFLSNRDGNVEVYGTAAGSGTDENLTHTPEANEWLTADAWAPDGSVIAYSSALRDPGENPLGLALGATGIILQSILIVGVLLVARRADRLPTGAITLILVVGTVILAAVSGEWQFVVGAAAAGVVADAIVWWLRRTRPRLEVPALAFGVPALAATGYFLALAAAGGLGWALPVTISAVGLSGTAGLLTGFLVAPHDTAPI